MLTGLKGIRKAAWIGYWPRLSSKLGSVQPPSRLGHQDYMRDDSAEILFQSFLRKAIVGSFGTDRDVHSLTLSINHFLC